MLGFFWTLLHIVANSRSVKSHFRHQVLLQCHTDVCEEVPDFIEYLRSQKCFVKSYFIIQIAL